VTTAYVYDAYGMFANKRSINTTNPDTMDVDEREQPPRKFRYLSPESRYSDPPPEDTLSPALKRMHLNCGWTPAKPSTSSILTLKHRFRVNGGGEAEDVSDSPFVETEDEKPSSDAFSH